MFSRAELVPESHALLLFDEERLDLHRNILLKCELVPQQALQSRLGVSQPFLEVRDGVVDLSNFPNQAVLDRIADELLAWAVRANLESSVSQHHGSCFPVNGGLQLRDVPIHKLYLTDDLQVGKDSIRIRSSKPKVVAVSLN